MTKVSVGDNRGDRVTTFSDIDDNEMFLVAHKLFVKCEEYLVKGSVHNSTYNSRKVKDNSPAIFVRNDKVDFVREVEINILK